MRLTIAIAALSTSLLSEHGSGNLVQARQEQKDLLSVLLRTPASSFRSVVSGNEGVASRRRGTVKHGVLQNFINAQVVPPAKECDPDVGVLACGLGQFCQASRGASLGGKCLPLPYSASTRDLQEPEASFTVTTTANCTDCLSGPGVFCDPNSFFYGNYDCECADWTVANKTGSIACILSEKKCNQNCTESPPTCYAVDFDYYRGASGSSYQYCYNFTTPFDQTFCFGFANDQTCFIAVDGSTCNSCRTTYQIKCKGDSCSQEPCAVFDCENVGLGSGNSCEDPVIAPAFQECWLDINGIYPRCSVCPDPEGVLYPENYIEIPGRGSFNCTYLERFAKKGLLGPQECLNTARIAEDVCCTKRSVPFICNICEEENHTVSKRKPNSSKMLRSVYP